jgi:hypothetical protein
MSINSGSKTISASIRRQISESAAACALATMEWKNGVPVNLMEPAGITVTQHNQWSVREE